MQTKQITIKGDFKTNYTNWFKTLSNPVEKSIFDSTKQTKAKKQGKKIKYIVKKWYSHGDWSDPKKETFCIVYTD